MTETVKLRAVPRPAKLPKIGLISLGCAKNIVDSEAIMGELVDAGFEITANEREADTIIINTCGFLQSARRTGRKHPGAGELRHGHRYHRADPGRSR